MDYHRLWLEVSNDGALCLFLPRTPGRQGLEQTTVILTLNLWVIQRFFNSSGFLTDRRLRKKDEVFWEVFNLSGDLELVQIQRENSSFIIICFLTQIHKIHEDTTKLTTIFIFLCFKFISLQWYFCFSFPFLEKTSEAYLETLIHAI